METKMVYYKDLTTSEVYGYDEIDSLQLPYIQQAIDNGWEDITGSYPLPPPDPTYKELRAAEYPPIGDQLDLLYKDMLADKGDKTGAWFTAVKTVKDKYPKS